MDKIDIAQELCESKISDIILLTTEQVKKIKKILELDHEDFDIVMLLGKK